MSGAYLANPPIEPKQLLVDVALEVDAHRETDSAAIDSAGRDPRAGGPLGSWRWLRRAGPQVELLAEQTIVATAFLLGATRRREHNPFTSAVASDIYHERT